MPVSPYEVAQSICSTHPRHPTRGTFRETPQISAGVRSLDIYSEFEVALTGIENIDISDTIASLENPQAMPKISIDEPTLSMIFSVNNSPFCGQDGKYVTSRNLRERLYRELRSNVALKVEDTETPDALRVSGRGLLHLSVLIENMRREGYELQVSKPKVTFKELKGEKAEPHRKSTRLN